MFKMTFWSWLLQGVPESILTVAVAVTIARIDLDWKKVCLIGFYQGIIAYIVRQLPIMFGIHTIILIFSLTFFLLYFFKANVFNAIKGAVLTFILLLIFEITFFQIINAIIPQIKEMLSLTPMLKVLLGLPQEIALLLTALYIDKRNKIVTQV